VAHQDPQPIVMEPNSPKSSNEELTSSTGQVRRETRMTLHDLRNSDQIRHKLNLILQDDVITECLETFLRKEQAAENLYFLKRTRAFRDNFTTITEDNYQEALQEAKNIFNEFISDQSRQQIFLSPKTKAELTSTLGVQEVQLTSDLFATSDAEVYKLLSRDKMQRFLSSDAFRRLEQQGELTTEQV
jgi:DNA-directed RNA polymerase subunit F